MFAIISSLLLLSSVAAFAPQGKIFNLSILTLEASQQVVAVNANPDFVIGPLSRQLALIVAHKSITK